VFNKKWVKDQFGGRKWYGKQQCLPTQHKKWAGNWPPCQVGFAVYVGLRFSIAPWHEAQDAGAMASGINIYSQLLITTVRIVDIKNSNC